MDRSDWRIVTFLVYPLAITGSDAIKAFAFMNALLYPGIWNHCRTGGEDSIKLLYIEALRFRCCHRYLPGDRHVNTVVSNFI